MARAKGATQQDRIIDYMKMNPEITQRDAIWLGCYRLAAQIFDLKRKGYTIATEIREVVNKDGTTSRIAAYSLVNSPDMVEKQVTMDDIRREQA